MIAEDKESAWIEYLDDLEYDPDTAKVWSLISCGYETYRICTIEDEEHFGEVGLRLTPLLGREMRKFCPLIMRNLPSFLRILNGNDLEGRINLPSSQLIT